MSDLELEGVESLTKLAQILKRVLQRKLLLLKRKSV
jgi:hypothetical protein